MKGKILGFSILISLEKEQQRPEIQSLEKGTHGWLPVPLKVNRGLQRG